MQRLTQVETVTVNLPVGRDFDCRVIAAAGVTAALRPLVPPAKLPSRMEGVLLSFVHEGRLIGLKGSVARDGEIVRFTIEDGAPKSGRRSTRVPAALAVKLRHVERDVRADGTTINIATEGVLLRSDLAVATDDELELEIALPTPLVTRGRVVRHADDLLAVEFHHEAYAAAAEWVISEKLRAQPV